MPSQVKTWIGISLLLCIGLLVGGSFLKMEDKTPEYLTPGLNIAAGEAVVLGIICVLILLFGRRLGFALGFRQSDQDSSADLSIHTRRPYATLFIISFVVLFVELMLIRYCSSQIRIFSFYKNVPLISCFLGLGLGCFLTEGRSRHALGFLLWFLPLSVFFSAGAIVLSNVLGKHAARGTSEHMLGDYLPVAVSATDQLISQLIMACFCIATLVVLTLLFALLGRLLGTAFEPVPRLRGYTVNILGSLAGILAFSGLSYLETPPWTWFLVGLAPLLWWMSNRVWMCVAAVLILLNAAAVFPYYGETVWSRYQKLVGHRIFLGGDEREGNSAYLLEISDVFYQIAADSSKTTVKQLKVYDAVYENLPTPVRVLVVGAGMGNDVSSALRAGAKAVDAVDIDPAIIEIGELNHPERPYDDPRVQIIVDDARHAFRYLPKASYDVVLFGLLDSHTQLGMSSVRLDNYVFTMESLAEAKHLVKQDGHLVIVAATSRPWFRERFQDMMKATVGGPVESRGYGAWQITFGAVQQESTSATTDVAVSRGALPTDDWPFLYLPGKNIPKAYWIAVVCLVIASVLVLRIRGLKFGRFDGYHGHLFFLGSSFLLMEVNAINRLALLFGTTWIVSAIAIAIVLLLIVLANLTVMIWGRLHYGLAYTLLGVSLVLSLCLQPGMILGKGTLAALGFGVLILCPVYFAGLIFAQSFNLAPVAATAIGANILGSVLGGWIEYTTMMFGMRALVVLAGGGYFLSLLLMLFSPGFPKHARASS